MSVRSGAHDIAPKEAKRLFRVLDLLVRFPERETVRNEAAILLAQIKGRARQIPANPPNRFVLVSAAKPIEEDFDNWMNHNREVKAFDYPHQHLFRYYGYSARPRQLSTWAAKRGFEGRGCYAYFIEHRKAKLDYYRDLPPLALHYNLAYPIFQTLDLEKLEIACGPYTGQRVIELLKDGPGVFMVKNCASTKSTIAYATWVAHLAPPYASKRG